MTRKLTEKQEAFVVAYLETADAVEAYMLAYDTSGMSEASIKKEAKRLTIHPLIAPRLRKVDVLVQAKGLRSLEDHISKLEEYARVAIENGQTGVATKCEELIGKVSRLYVIQVEHGGVGDFTQVPDAELDEMIKTDVKELGLSVTRH